MKESYNEGIANHIGPESCGSHGDVAAEALSRGIRRPLKELRKHPSRGPTLWTEGEGNTNACADREHVDVPAESLNLACGDALFTQDGRPRKGPIRMGHHVNGGPVEGASRTDRFGPLEESDEAIVPKKVANKASRRGGVAGGKGLNGEKDMNATEPPDTEPGLGFIS